jgi:hypothetical protein
MKLKNPLKSANRMQGAQGRRRRSREFAFSLPEVLFAIALTGFSAVSVFIAA